MSATKTTTNSTVDLRHNEFVIDSKVYAYPSLMRRVQALFIDMLILLTVFLALSMLFPETDGVQAVKISVLIVILLTYEPLLTVYSRTVGQRMMNLAVRKKDNPDERISLSNAYIRWITKGLLGWISFITINFNPEHRAIHDMASGSVMVIKEW